MTLENPGSSSYPQLKKMGTRKNPKDFGRNVTNTIGNMASEDEGGYGSLNPK
jgi:hypothetical protein